MAVTIQKTGRRYYLHGIPNTHAASARAAHLHWDSNAGVWWTGLRRRAKQVQTTIQRDLDRRYSWSMFTTRGEDPDTGPGIWFELEPFIRVWVDEEAIPWVDEWLKSLMLLPLSGLTELELAIHHRRHLDTIWARQNEGQPAYPGGPYDFRAYTWSNKATIFVDETETPESTLFVLLHEVAHIAIRNARFIWHAFNLNKATFEWGDDDAHEADPEEQFCNMAASSWLAVLGRPQPSIFYDRYWWRARVNALRARGK